MVQQARSASESRFMMKQFGGRHKDLNKGEDMKDHKKMLDKKGKKMMDKSRGSKTSEKGANAHSQRKIMANSRPTRSKQIVRRK